MAHILPAPFSSAARRQMPSYPGENSPRDATLQFLKVSRLNMAQGRTEFLLLNGAFIALLASLYFARRYLSWAVLWTPLPFYVLCIAWGSVPIYHPEWWPFSYYNVRYGLQLLPAVAVFAALGCEFLTSFFRIRYVVAAAALVIAASYYSVWQTTPICLREAQVNGKDRMALDRQLGRDAQDVSACSNFHDELRRASRRHSDGGLASSPGVV